VVSVKGALNGFVAVVCLAIGVVAIVMYRMNNTAYWYLLWASVIFIILALVFGALFLSGKLNKTEDIHITE
jgi:tellurite resistance protein TehA-like permease